MRLFSLLRTIRPLQIRAYAIPSEQSDESESVKRHVAVTPVRSVILNGNRISWRTGWN